MRIFYPCVLLGSTLFITPAWTLAQQVAGLAQTVEAPLRRLTLPEARLLAETANPVLRNKLAQRSAIEGMRSDASALLYNNPTLTLDGTRRAVPGDAGVTQQQNEWGASLAQTFELAGQQGYRRSMSSAAQDAFQAEAEATRREILAEVSQRFYKVLILQRRVAIEEQALALFDKNAEIIQKRRSAGEDTRRDANMAQAEAERARNALAQAREELTLARGELGSTLQFDPDWRLEAQGELQPRNAPYTLEDLLRGIPYQPRLRAINSRIEAAQARLKLENASTYPDLTVSLGAAREGSNTAREKVTMLSFSFPLPAFRRNASGIGQASTELSQAQIEQKSVMRDTAAQIRTLWTKLQSAESRMRRLQDTVLPMQESNQQLTEKSRLAGEISLLEMIVMTRQTLDVRRDLLDAQSDYFTTCAALEQAAGWKE